MSDVPLRSSASYHCPIRDPGRLADSMSDVPFRSSALNENLRWSDKAILKFQ